MRVRGKPVSCCFTGHRPAKLPWGTDEGDERCLRLKARLREVIARAVEDGYTHFICGMAIGCDTFFAEAVIALREQHGDITLEAAVPCGSQPDKWTKAQRLRYNELLDRCDTVTVLQYGYTDDCMMQRNRYMVDRSSLLLACFDGRPGGTMSTIVYAERQGLKTVIIEL